MKQLSLIPDEPQEGEPKKKKKYSPWKLRTRWEHFLKEEGYYNYCLMVLEVRTLSETYILDNYKLTKKELLEMLEDVFKNACLWSEDIDGFLHKTKTIPNYALAYVPKNAEANNKKGRKSS